MGRCSVWRRFLKSVATQALTSWPGPLCAKCTQRREANPFFFIQNVKWRQAPPETLLHTRGSDPLLVLESESQVSKKVFAAPGLSQEEPRWARGVASPEAGRSCRGGGRPDDRESHGVPGLSSNSASSAVSAPQPQPMAGDGVGPGREQDFPRVALRIQGLLIQNWPQIKWSPRSLVLFQP